MSETVIAFACLYLCGIETVVAFARWYLWWVETVIAFAGAKWVFLVQFSGAEVMVVSMVAVQGRAVVLSVSKSPCCRVSCAKKFALRGLMVGVSAKKFALHAQNTPKSAFLRLLGELIRGRSAGGAVLGELFRGNATGEAVLGELFAEMSLEGPCWASFFADRHSWDPTGRVVLCRDPASWARPAGSVNPSIRSYTRLAEAGHGRPTRPQQPSPQRKALTKGKRLLVKAVTSLDNGRKWRVYAGRTLELLR